MPAAPIVHFEIGFRDAAKAKSFYGPLLGWEFQDYGPAQMLTHGSGHGSIGGHFNQLGHPPHNYTVVYAQVDDLQKTIDHAIQLGGKQLVGITPVPGMGSFAWIADPEGNPFGLWKVARA